MAKFEADLNYETWHARPCRPGVPKNVVICAAMAAVLIAASASLVMYMRGQQRIHDLNEYRRILIRRELRDFSVDFMNCAITNGPPIVSSNQTLRETLDRLCRDPYTANLIRGDAPRLLSGTDYWGHPFIFKVSDDRRTIMISSAGPNGKDEQGLGDDVCIRLYNAGGKYWDSYP